MKKDHIDKMLEEGAVKMAQQISMDEAKGYTAGIAERKRELMGRISCMDPNGVDSEGNTVAHWSDDPEILRLLKKRGADLDKQNNWGMSPLMTASWKGDIKKCKTLLGLGCDASVLNSWNKTGPLQCAIDGESAEMEGLPLDREGFTKVAKLLIRAGALKSLTNEQIKETKDHKQIKGTPFGLAMEAELTARKEEAVRSLRKTKEAPLEI
jgi:ankyrin repeat protein